MACYNSVMSNKDFSLKHGSTHFLRAAIVIMGLCILGLCIFALPAGITSDTTGYYWPILAGLYLPAIPFFIALRQAMSLLDFIDRNQAFSTGSLKALKKIKLCALLISGLFSLGMPYIFYAADLDDAPGVVAIGLVIIGASLVIATFASLLHKLFQNGMELKSENDLTV